MSKCKVNLQAEKTFYFVPALGVQVSAYGVQIQGRVNVNLL